jgi:hypothetical protein
MVLNIQLPVPDQGDPGQVMHHILGNVQQRCGKGAELSFPSTHDPVPPPPRTPGPVRFINMLNLYHL